MNDQGSVAYENVPEKDLDHTINTRIQDEKNAKRDMLGFILGVVASASLAVGVGCVQALQGAIPHFEINAMRFIFIFLVTSVSFLVRRDPPKIPRGDIIYVTMYAVMVNIFSLTLYASVGYIPLGVAGSATRIVAMVMVLPLAKIFLGESVTFLKIVGVVVGSIGLVLVCKPELFYSHGETSLLEENNLVSGNLTVNSTAPTFTNHTLTEDGTISSLAKKPEYLGYILAAISALNSVLHNILQKNKLSKIDSSKLCFWFGLSGIVVCTILSAIFEKMTLPKDGVSWMLILGHCVGVCVMSLSAVYAQKIASSIIVQLALSLQIFFFFLGQYFFLQGIFPTEGSWVEILGAVLSATSVTLVPAIHLLSTKCNRK